MTTADALARFEATNGSIADARDLQAGSRLRAAITTRDLDEVLVAKQLLAGAEAVDSGLRDAVAASLQAIGEPDHRLDLGLTAPEREELIHNVLWFDVALGWSWYGPAVTGVLACGDLRWQAFIDEVAGAGDGELRDLEVWKTAEPADWPDTAAIRRLQSLSGGARFVLAVANAFTRERVAELHVIGRKVLFDTDTLARCLDELVAADLAEVPASLRSLAMDLTLRELQDVATSQGLKSTGTKATVLDRLLSGGHEGSIAAAVRSRGWRFPIRIGCLPELKGVEAVASLWGEAFTERRGGDASDEDAAEWTAPPVRPPTAPTAKWMVERPAWVRAIAASEGSIIGLDGGEHLFRIDDGRERWSVKLDRPAAGWGEQPVLCDALTVVARDRHLAAFDLSTGVEAWRWSAPRGEELQGLPACDGERVFQTSTAGLHAIDLATGAALWGFRRRDLRSPTADGGLVVVAVRSDALHVLDAHDGHPLARHRLDGLPRDYWPLLIGTTVIVSGIENQRMATVGLDVHTGAVRWRHRDRDARTKSRGRRGEALLDCSWTVWAVDAETGKVSWKRPYQGHSAYLDSDGGAAVSTRQGVAVLSPENGKLIGDVPVSADAITAIASFPDGSVVLAAGKHVMRATPGRPTRRSGSPTPRRLPPSAPSPAWSTVVDGTVDALDISDGAVVVATGEAVARDLNSGEVLWRRDDLWFDQVAADLGIAVGTGGEEVVAVDVRTGAILWDRRLDLPAGAQLVLHGGDCFLVDEAATLLCLDVTSGEEHWSCDPPNRDDSIGGLTLPAPLIEGDVVVWADVRDRIFACDRRTGRHVDPAGRVAGPQRPIPPGLSLQDQSLTCNEYGWTITLDGWIDDVAVGDGVLVVSLSRGIGESPALVALK